LPGFGIDPVAAPHGVKLSADECVWLNRRGMRNVAGRLAMRYLASDTVTLQSMVARLNIELFCKKCRKR
jgi:hypothetical protein